MKSPQLIGVDISPSSVKMVELSASGKDNNGYRVERYAVEPIPKDAMLDGNIVNLEAIGESLERGWKKMGTRLKNVAMALPAAAVITKKIIVPAGQREDDLAFQVETEANQYIPFALDEVNLDFQLIGPAPNNPDEVEILIAASHKEKVEDRIAAALTAGLKTVVMDVEPYAAQTAFELIERKLPNGGKDQIIAVVDIGSTVMSINVLLNGQSVYMRDQPSGGNQLSEEIQRCFSLSPEEAETARRNEELPDNYKADVLNPFCENLALEVARAIQFFFSSTRYTEVNYIFLAGGCAAIPGLDEIVAARAQAQTLTVNPFADMALSNRVRPKLLSADAPSLLIACGLAMRSFDPS
ncbi:MAG: pilus assembly protein PilM [Betaproteobacteria bacterium]|nr:pilus assembly protein PilM [Betaproteobacteria bacterium]